MEKVFIVLLSIIICFLLLFAIAFPTQEYDWTDEVSDAGMFMSTSCCVAGALFSLGYVMAYPKSKLAWIATGILLAIFVLRYLAVKQMPVFGENAGL